MQIRYHHLRELIELRSRYASWEATTQTGEPSFPRFEELCQYPEIAHDLAMAYTDEQVEFAAESWQRSDYSVDYVGEKGQYIEEHRKAVLAFYESYLVASPDTFVT